MLLRSDLAEKINENWRQDRHKLFSYTFLINMSGFGDVFVLRFG